MLISNDSVLHFLPILFPSAILVVILLALRIRYKTEFTTELWNSLPVVGVPRAMLLPWTRGRLRALFSSSKNASTGYETFGKKGVPFVVPHPSVGMAVALPPSLLRLFDMGADRISNLGPTEAVQPKYMIGNPKLYAPPLFLDTARRQVSKERVGNLSALIAETVDAALRDSWGTDSAQWKTFNVWETCSTVVTRVHSRIYYGKSVSDNKTFLKQSAFYSITAHRSSHILSSIPMALRPVFGRLLGLAIKRPFAACTRILLPLVERRLKLCDSKDNGLLPDDALQGIIEKCAKSGPDQLNPTWITQNLLQLNQLSIYNTSYTLTNSVLDLFGSPGRDDFVNGLRAECVQIACQHHGYSTKDAVDGLYRIDSAIRESMRISAPYIMAFPRIVSPGDDLDLGNGFHIPGGVRICVPMQAIQRDANLYENPDEYDPFRFSRRFEGPENASNQATKQELSILASDTFLGWGYGKKACPARWYATMVLKLTLAYILLHYDVELMGTRQRRALLNMNLPDTATRIRVRRRSPGATWL